MTLSKHHEPAEIEQVIIPRSNDIGGFEVKRALPNAKRRMVGPFIFWDQMGPGEFLTDHGLDVRPHPHINLSTLTYLYHGRIHHKDSLGSDQMIEPGAINLMTAGSGIVHSERSAEQDRKAPHSLFGIQSWMALPQDLEECDPSFLHVPEADIKVIEDKGIVMRLVAGNIGGVKSEIAFPYETLYADIMMEAGASFEAEKQTEERALYITQGSVDIHGDSFEAGQMLILTAGKSVTIKATAQSRVMLLGGATMDGPRHIWWNFVSSRKERIEDAKDNWRNGKFDMVQGDAEFIPLPEQ